MKVSGLTLAPWAMMFVSLLVILLVLVSIYFEYRKSKHSKLHTTHKTYRYKKASKVAFLIASKDGQKTIAQTVRAARANGCPVFVVSDGSRDKTVDEARNAGAKVLHLRTNIGKPAALYKAYKHFKLSVHYGVIAILDDDVTVEKDFIKEAKKFMDRDTAISVGKNLTEWPANNWNVLLASRAYSYWHYQATLRRLQSIYNVMNCISGSNSLYRTEVLDQVLNEKTPYIVDDTFWTLETHRLELGKIVYAPSARAWIQDPTNFRDWYKQNLRWMWGTFQGIIGHRVGSEFNKFHAAYVALLIEWTIYILSGPLVIYMICRSGLRRLPLELFLLCCGYGIWVLAAAIALKRPRLIVFIPAIVVLDFIFRALMVHALLKALRQRTVESCVWSSPKRFDTRTLVDTA